MIKIRTAAKADAPLLLDFIRQLAEYEHLLEHVRATPEDILRDGFGATPRFRALIAEADGEPAGFALYYYNYSTFAGRAGIYLEDYFVRPELRGRGVGRALMARLAAIARAEGCRVLQWAVLDWNQSAIDFYRARGGEFLDAWRLMSLGGESFARMADEGEAFA